MLPKPFTIPIAAARFAGGLGIAFETQTSVRAKPDGGFERLWYECAVTEGLDNYWEFEGLPA